MGEFTWNWEIWILCTERSAMVFRRINLTYCALVCGNKAFYTDNKIFDNLV